MAELSFLPLQTLNQISLHTEKGRRRGGKRGQFRGGGECLVTCTATPPPPSPLLLVKLGLDQNPNPSSELCTRSFIVRRCHNNPPNYLLTEVSEMEPDLMFLSDGRAPPSNHKLLGDLDLDLDDMSAQTSFNDMSPQLGIYDVPAQCDHRFAQIDVVDDDMSSPASLGCISARTYIALSTQLELDTAVRMAREKKQESEEQDDFYANLGSAIRTLREEMPHLFCRDLTYEIYRDDITFHDRRNKFTGIDNYKLMFWSLRFHARMFFKVIWVEVLRIWQPSDRVIVVKWAVHGIPRVPWKAQGLFEGTSEYKLDKTGKIYEHKVDNRAKNQPPFLRTQDMLRLLSPVPCVTPTPTFFERVPFHTWMISSEAMGSKCVRIFLDMDQYSRMPNPNKCLSAQSRLVWEGLLH